MTTYGVGLDANVDRLMLDTQINLKNLFGSKGTLHLNKTLGEADRHGMGKLDGPEFESALNKLGLFYKKTDMQALVSFFGDEYKQVSWRKFTGRYSEVPGKKIRVVLGCTSATKLANGHPTGVWLEEATAPYWVFIDAGFEVQFASVSGGVVTVDAVSQDSTIAANQRFCGEGKIGLLKNTKSFSAVNANDFDALFLCGGHGTCVDFENGSKDLVERFWNAGKVVAAVCHGPIGLVKAQVSGRKLLEGKKCTGFTNVEEVMVGLDKVVPSLEGLMVKAGGVFSCGAPWSSHCVVDGQLVTGQNPMSSKATADAVRTILDRSKSNQLNATKKGWVHRIFDKLDTNQNGVIELGDLQNNFQTTTSLKFLSGRQTQAQAKQEFFSTFDANADGTITIQEFENYYSMIGQIVTDDFDFEELLKKTWGADFKDELVTMALNVNKGFEYLKSKILHLVGDTCDEFKLNSYFGNHVKHKSKFLTFYDFDVMWQRLEMPHAENDLLLNIFKKIDGDSSGYIEFNEFRGFLYPGA